MKILALDSSGLVASVAIIADGTLLAEYTVNYKKTHSQTLLPMLDEIARMVELDRKTIDAIAVAAGPDLLQVFGSGRLPRRDSGSRSENRSSRYLPLQGSRSISDLSGDLSVRSWMQGGSRYTAGSIASRVTA